MASPAPVPALLFQSHPEDWDLRKYFSPGGTVDWRVTRYAEQMRPGALVLFWEARGKEEPEVRGLYGWGITSGTLIEGTDGKPRAPTVYVERWVSERDHARDVPPEKHVAPIPAERVLALPSWKEHLLAKFPAGTNFLVTERQLDELAKLVARRVPESKLPKAAEAAPSGPLQHAAYEPRMLVARGGMLSLLGARIHSDRYAVEDQLGYSIYATAIAQFIQHQETEPTLVIGILAPWGQGKTTLMRLVQAEFKERARRRAEELERHEAGDSQMRKTQKTSPANGEDDEAETGAADPERPARFRDLRRWLDELGEFRKEEERSRSKLLQYPTVWFNAWHFESREQVWAGLAHSIVVQLVDQLPTRLQKEKFWLGLQARRLDLNRVRADVHSAVFERFVPKVLHWGALGMVALVTAVAAAVGGGIADPNAASLGRGAASGGLAAAVSGLLAIAFNWLRAQSELASQPLEGRFARYVRQPDYAERRGFLTEVREDVEAVLDLLVDPEKPAVIFIDDLDRCSPNRVAEIMEALNHFVGGDLRAYFILGMDAQVVAAAMELAHEKLKNKLNETTRRYGSLGWYYMEKFIQLQFVLPSLSEPERKRYLKLQLGAAAAPAEDETLDEARVAESKAKIDQALESEALDAGGLVNQVAGDFKTLRRADPREAWRRARKVLEKAAPQLGDENPMIGSMVRSYAPHLGSNPRAIKRFVNLLRFYLFSQWARSLEGLESAQPDELARWIVIMLRWPELVRWIQWEGEENLVSHPEPESKATEFERKAVAARSFATWSKAIERAWKGRYAELKDRELFDFLRLDPDPDKGLGRAVRLGLW